MPKLEFERFKDLSGQLSIHGPADIVYSSTIWQRLLWIIAVLLAVAAATVGIYGNVYDYQHSSIITSHTIKSERIKFPDVYICPHNPTNRDAESGYPKMWTEGLLSVANDGKLLGKVTKMWDLSNRVEDQNNQGGMGMPHPSNRTDYFMNTSFTVNQFVTECKFQQNKQNCTDIVQRVFDKDYGLCFLVKSGREQTVAGAGLQVVLDLHSELQSFKPFLNGVVLRIERQHDPTVVGTNLVVKAGGSTKISLEATRTVLINYKSQAIEQNCLEPDDWKESDFQVLQNLGYSKSACRLDCVQQMVQRECNCTLAIGEHYMKPEYRTTCSIRKTKLCYVKEMMVKQSILDEMAVCSRKCLNPCDHWSYHHSVTHARILDDFYTGPDLSREGTWDNDPSWRTGNQERDDGSRESEANKTNAWGDGGNSSSGSDWGTANGSARNDSSGSKLPISEPEPEPTPEVNNGSALINPNTTGPVVIPEDQETSDPLQIPSNIEPEPIPEEKTNPLEKPTNVQQDPTPENEGSSNPLEIPSNIEPEPIPEESSNPLETPSNIEPATLPEKQVTFNPLEKPSNIDPASEDASISLEKSSATKTEATIQTVAIVDNTTHPTAVQNTNDTTIADESKLNNSSILANTTVATDQSVNTTANEEPDSTITNSTATQEPTTNSTTDQGLSSSTENNQNSTSNYTIITGGGTSNSSEAADTNSTQSLSGSSSTTSANLPANQEESSNSSTNEPQAIETTATAVENQAAKPNLGFFALNISLLQEASKLMAQKRRKREDAWNLNSDLGLPGAGSEEDTGTPVPDWLYEAGPVDDVMGHDPERLTKDYIILDIAFGEIRYHEITQQPAISQETFLSNIGGQLGLWMGASILSLVEILVVLFLCCHPQNQTEKTKVKQLGEKPLPPPPQESEKKPSEDRRDSKARQVRIGPMEEEPKVKKPPPRPATGFFPPAGDLASVKSVAQNRRILSQFE